jgi:hypothetical protein
MVRTPAGQVGRSVAVAVSRVSTCAFEHSVGQPEVAADASARWAKSAGGVPTVGDDELAAAPSLLVLQEPGKFCPTRVGDGAGEATVGEHATHVKVLDDELVVRLDQQRGNLMKEMPPYVRDACVVAPQFRYGLLVIL